ncbi:hypothetical protein FB45DRAFT_923016 [Roridomyces roridus]|uniref:Uncharacterized protein n=1 Tax=Roridomyces roridus TaxID=1738132 RepID=A0AAD7BB56_9AGAR|nr:hypothetical protein FB45DRAFT_939644 [Roridomyces roridus]KAJ7615391.1 hypothetical protein FB45DRAFT_935591 [Roridomyces roridus]KAJ7626136.1 hypothetical protein FB45DRAFT_923016 [Roridomyces roridus]
MLAIPDDSQHSGANTSRGDAHQRTPAKSNNQGVHSSFHSFSLAHQVIDFLFHSRLYFRMPSTISLKRTSTLSLRSLLKLKRGDGGDRCREDEEQGNAAGYVSQMYNADCSTARLTIRGHSDLELQTNNSRTTSAHALAVQRSFRTWVLYRLGIIKVSSASGIFSHAVFASVCSLTHTFPVPNDARAAEP